MVFQPQLTKVPVVNVRRYEFLEPSWTWRTACMVATLVGIAVALNSCNRMVTLGEGLAVVSYQQVAAQADIADIKRALQELRAQTAYAGL